MFPSRYDPRRLMAVVFVTAFALCGLLTKAHVVSWNDGSRIATVDALISNHTFQIDGSPYAAGLGDEIRFHGRTYSDKPPLLAVLGAGVAALVAPFGISLRHTPDTAIVLITLGTVGLCFAAGCVYAYAFQRALGLAPPVAFAVALLSGGATLALPYATVMVNHVPCGAAGVAGCYYLYRARRSRDFVLAGVFFGLVYAFDAAGVVYAVAAAVLLWRCPIRIWLLSVAGAAPFVALQFAYNLAISGSILPTVYNISAWSDPSLPLHHLVTTEALHVFTPREYAGFFVNELVGIRGIIPFTPLVLVAAYGFARMWRAQGRTRMLSIAVIATFVVYVLLIVFLQNDTYSLNYGERRYVDLFFVLCIGLGPAFVATRGTVPRVATLTLVGVSAASAVFGTVAPFGGTPHQWGFAYVAHEVVMLERRAPVQSTLDLMLLVIAVTAAVRLTSRAIDAANVSGDRRPPRA